jgi:glycosyltransferase involved in cell wall biosynthesis
MSVHNDARFVSESVNSILNQTLSDFEFLIVDDCSTDGSYNILKMFAQLDCRIKLSKNTVNLGLTKSLNKILKKSKGNYIARMDADDISSKYRLEKGVSAFKQDKNIGVVFSLSELIDSNDHVICKKWQPKKIRKILNLMPYHNYITHSSCMVDVAVFRKYGGYNEKYYLAQDWELWLRFINLDVKFHCINEKLLLLRMHDSNISNKISKNLKNSSLNYFFTKYETNVNLMLFYFYSQIS